TVPVQIRGYVLAGHAEAVVDLLIAHVLFMGNVIALNGEGRHLRHEIVRQRSPVGHRSSSRKWSPVAYQCGCPRYFRDIALRQPIRAPRPPQVYRGVLADGGTLSGRLPRRESADPCVEIRPA